MSSIAIQCPDCEALVINGTPCHELGCPSSHVDLSTGQPYPVPCWICGCDFTPESREEALNRYAVCPDCKGD